MATWYSSYGLLVTFIFRLYFKHRIHCYFPLSFKQKISYHMCCHLGNLSMSVHKRAPSFFPLVYLLSILLNGITFYFKWVKRFWVARIDPLLFSLHFRLTYIYLTFQIVHFFTSLYCHWFPLFPGLPPLASPRGKCQ